MNKQKVIAIAKEVVNTAIKNSEIAKPYIKDKHYIRAMVALNAVHWALKRANKE